jgi:hypothetical protein
MVESGTSTSVSGHGKRSDCWSGARQHFGSGPYHAISHGRRIHASDWAVQAVSRDARAVFPAVRVFHAGDANLLIMLMRRRRELRVREFGRHPCMLNGSRGTITGERRRCGKINQMCAIPPLSVFHAVNAFDEFPRQAIAGATPLCRVRHDARTSRARCFRNTCLADRDPTPMQRHREGAEK